MLLTIHFKSAIVYAVKNKDSQELALTPLRREYLKRELKSFKEPSDSSRKLAVTTTESVASKESKE